MEGKIGGPTTAENVCARLHQYFGDKYEVSSNNVDLFAIKSNLKECVYFESEDLMIIDSIANEFGLAIDRWRLVVANGCVGVYCLLEPQESAHVNLDIIFEKDRGTIHKLSA